MRFLADMGVAVPIVEELRRQGHDALHLRDEGLQRSPDQHILDKAIAEDRILLTFDLDFGELAALARDRVVSVILFRLSNARMANVALRLSTVLAPPMHYAGAPLSSSKTPNPLSAHRERIKRAALF